MKNRIVAIPPVSPDQIKFALEIVCAILTGQMPTEPIDSGRVLLEHDGKGYCLTDMPENRILVELSKAFEHETQEIRSAINLRVMCLMADVLAHKDAPSFADYFEKSDADIIGISYELINAVARAPGSYAKGISLKSVANQLRRDSH